MKYVGCGAGAIVVILLVVCAVYLYGIFEESKKLQLLNKYRTKADNGVPMLKKKTVLILMLVNFVIVLAVMIWLGMQSLHSLDMIKLVVLLPVLLALAIIDARYHILPNKILIATLGVRVILYGIEFFVRRDQAVAIGVSALLGFLFGFGVLFIMALLTKHALGYGDVKLFGVIGLYLGLFPTYSVLLYSLIVCSFIGLYFMLVKKTSRKYKVPFGPAIYVGYLIVLILGLY